MQKALFIYSFLLAICSCTNSPKDSRIVNKKNTDSIDVKESKSSFSMFRNETFIRDSFGLINDSSIVSFLTCGTIASNAKYLEVDEIEPFFGGVAIIKKGSSYALINDTGGIVQPFNKYKQFMKLEVYPEYFGNLGFYNVFSKPVKIIVARENGTLRTHFLNTKGEFVSESVLNDFISPDEMPSYNEHGFGGISIYKREYFNKRFPGYLDLLVSIDGKMIPINKNHEDDFSPDNNYTNPNSKFTCGLTPVNDGRSGFANRGDELVIKKGFEEVSEFSEGLCAVAILDEYGTKKWGYIDTTGNWVIEPKFTNKPEKFCCGRAMIYPIGLRGIRYAYIDRKGDTKFFLTENYADTTMVIRGILNSYMYTVDRFPLNDYTIFVNGYKFIELRIRNENSRVNTGGLYLMDTSGKFIPTFNKLRDKLIALNTQRPFLFGRQSIFALTNIQNEQFIYDYNGPYNGGLGVCNIYGQFTLLPVFNTIELFQPESNVQYAEYYDTKTKRVIQGYIDRKGVFQLVLKPYVGY